MLKFLKRSSYSRTAWIFISITAFALEIAAFWFQNIMEMQICARCMYERYAILGIISAGLIGAIAPKTLMRYIAIIVWIFSAWKGIFISWKHVIQLNPLSFLSCNFITHFPFWFSLEKWIPRPFFSGSDCTASQWESMNLKLPQWLLGIFIFYFLVALLVLIAQCSFPKRRDPFIR